MTKFIDYTKCIHLEHFDTSFTADGVEVKLYKCKKGHKICQESMSSKPCEDFEIGESKTMTEVDVYEKGTVRLEEWEDVNYCEHSFCVDGEYLNDNEVVDLLDNLIKTKQTLNELNRILHATVDELIKENNHLKELHEFDEETIKKLQRIRNFEIPVNEIEDMVVDYKRRVIGIYYKE